MAAIAWTKHCKSPEEKQLYLESLSRGKWLLDDIKKLLASNLSSLEADEISPKVYKDNSWAFRQAHSNGYKQALRDFNKLLTLDQGQNEPPRPTGSERPRRNTQQVERQTA